MYLSPFTFWWVFSSLAFFSYGIFSSLVKLFQKGAATSATSFMPPKNLLFKKVDNMSEHDFSCLFIHVFADFYYLILSEFNVIGRTTRIRRVIRPTCCVLRKSKRTQMRCEKTNSLNFTFRCKPTPFRVAKKYSRQLTCLYSLHSSCSAACRRKTRSLVASSASFHRSDLITQIRIV